MEFYWYFLFLLVSFLYASIGHGGASGYIALMTLMALNPNDIRANALMLNIIVASIAFFNFYKVVTPQLKLIFPLFLGSIPMAYIGGVKELPNLQFKWILAAVLLVPIIRFIKPKRNQEDQLKQTSFAILLVTGAIIGFVSGLIGIGGGILLTPLLLWFSWTSVTQAAVISALFIVVNSVSGLIGFWKNQIFIPDSFWAIFVATVLGGLLGSYLGANRFNDIYLKRILAGVLSIAVLKLIWT
ncbi:MAG: sulfite exporter TauE/SafE family protein [Flavobacteriales bacterium]|nr:sulfite exporter TauE/SafE family protein [Flavobacteriales bacterium]